MRNLILVFLATLAFSWEGYDWENNSYIEIEKGNLVRDGKNIEIYDYKDGSYKEVEVQNIDKIGNTIEVEIYDKDTKKYRTFEMENKNRTYNSDIDSYNGIKSFELNNKYKR